MKVIMNSISKTNNDRMRDLINSEKCTLNLKIQQEIAKLIKSHDLYVLKYGGEGNETTT